MMLLSYAMTFLMTAVIYYDISRYKIPNWIPGLMLVAYPLAVWIAPYEVDWLSALMLAGATLAAGLLVFVLRWMGGGDIKLLVACVLWTGMTDILDYLGLVAVLGGVLSIVLLTARWAIPRLPLKNWTPPRILTKDAPVPYGLAIAGAFLYLLWTGRIETLHWIY